MMKFIRAGIALLFTALAFQAQAQGVGQLDPGQAWANEGTTSALAAPSHGIATNTLNAKTANYTIATTDCGKTIQAGTGSTGLFTITLPAVSGFASNCIVNIKNGDTARGKVLSGFPADLWNILYPQQQVEVKIVNGAWATSVNPGRWQPLTALTLQVDHTSGSNTVSDCLGTGAGACATILHALELLQTQISPPQLTLSGAFPQIQSDCGFTESPTLTGSGASKTGLVTIVGNAGSPSSCVWNAAAITVDKGAVIGFNGFTFRLTSGTGALLNISKMGIAAVWNDIWGTATGATHIQISDNGVLSTDPGTHQVGEAACAPNCMATHVQNIGGTWKQGGAQTVSVPNALTFTQWYSGNNSGANLRFDSAMTFTGTGSGAGSTGSKFNVNIPASISLSGTTLPGASAGVIGCTSCVLLSGTARGDSNYTILSTDRYVYTNATLTAPRTWTLPAANSLTSGSTIWIQDAAIGITATNTLTIARAGADTINTGATSIVITNAGGGFTLTTDGVSNWGSPVQTMTSGGTGRTSLTNHALVIGAGSNPLTMLAVASNGQLLIGQTGADPAFATLSQDCTVTAAGVITCTKTNNVSFAASATTDTTNAANISSGVLAVARGGVDQTGWTAYTPTITCSNAGTITTLGTTTGRFKLLSLKTVQVQVDTTITSVGTCGGLIRATLPAGAATAAAFNYIGVAKEAALTGKSGVAQIVASGTFMAAADSTGTTFAASGAEVIFAMTYEIP